MKPSVAFLRTRCRGRVTAQALAAVARSEAGLAAQAAKVALRLAVAELGAQALAERLELLAFERPVPEIGQVLCPLGFRLVRSFPRVVRAAE